MSLEEYASRKLRGDSQALIAGNAGSHRDGEHRRTLWEPALPAMRPVGSLMILFPLHLA